jgi:hypothetical protein
MNGKSMKMEFVKRQTNTASNSKLPRYKESLKVRTHQIA